MEQDIDTRAERLKLLSETGPDTLMGKLLRRFWQPVAISERLPACTAQSLRVMSEDLTLYRGESGKPYLIGGRCAHRCTVLHTGWIEGDELRCMYHGWKYDGRGQCIETPAEKRPRPELVKIAGYPLHEYAGLIFAYMGEGAPPAFELPRKEVLEDSAYRTFIEHHVWDCNWFQQIENSLDAAHVSFAHVWGRMSRFGEEISTAIPDLAYSETPAGIRQVATRSKTNVRVSDWTFPNNNHIVSPGPDKSDPWFHICVWAVPVDDHHTMRFMVNAVPASAAEMIELLIGRRGFDPAHHYDELFRHHQVPDVGNLQLIALQDYVAIRGQGVVVDRTKERLGVSDAGVTFLRRLFWRELDAIRAGQPTKAWTKLHEATELPISIPDPA